jgi:hypothetical protein
VISLFSQRLVAITESSLTVTPAFDQDTLDAMEINPKVQNAAENGDLEQTITGGPSQPGDIQISDDVFGEVGEDGPNYRNVRFSWICMISLGRKR